MLNKSTPRVCPPVYQPINVNLKMRPVAVPAYGEPQPCQSPPAKDCWADCEVPKRPPRCAYGNYAERAVSMRPEYKYVPIEAAFNDNTTYKSFFALRPMEPRAQLFKPAYNLKLLRDKLESESLYKKEFVPFPVAPYKKPTWAKVEEFVPSDGCLSGISSYRLAYSGASGKPAESTRRFKMMDPDRAHLDPRTTYKCTYTPFSKDQYAKKTPKEKFKPVNCMPFKHTTTYMSDYIKLHGEQRQSMKRSPAAFGDKALNQTGNTTYKAEYEPFHFDKTCPDMPAKHYDQLYPRTTCQEAGCVVDCVCDNTPERGPWVRPSPPCPPAGGPPCKNENYEITNEDHPFEPTKVTMKSGPHIYSCCLDD